MKRFFARWSRIRSLVGVDNRAASTRQVESSAEVVAEHIAEREEVEEEEAAAAAEAATEDHGTPSDWCTLGTWGIEGTGHDAAPVMG